MSTATALPACKHAVLRGVSWEIYLALREDPENDQSRMTFHQGVLEITTLSYFDELVATVINRLICDWTVEHGSPMASSGCMTCQRKDLEAGLEPDFGYYIDKLPIYEEMGVAEVWHWENESVQVYRLIDNRYLEASKSQCLPNLPLNEISAALTRREQEGETAMTVAFRNSIRNQSN